MSALLLCIAAFITLNALLNIGYVGKPRKPMTPGAVVVVVLIDAFIATVLVLAALGGVTP